MQKYKIFIQNNMNKSIFKQNTEAGVTFDNSFFDNSFVLVGQFKNRSFLYS